MNFTKKRNIVIEFIRNTKKTLLKLIGIPCLIFIPYLYASALGYNTDVLPDVGLVWITGFLLIMFGVITPTMLLYLIITCMLISIKAAKITCRLPLTEEEMVGFAKNKTCEEILVNMQGFLTYTVWGLEYRIYKEYKYRELLKPFYLYIKNNYLTSDFGNGYAFMEDLEYLMTKECENDRF